MRKELHSNLAATERSDDCLVFLKIFDNDRIAETKVLLVDPKISLRDQLGLPSDYWVIFEPETLELIKDDERIKIKKYEEVDFGMYGYGLDLSIE